MSNESNSLWQLNGGDSCALFYSATSADIPRLIWFGGLLDADADKQSITALLDQPVPMAKLDAPIALDCFPQASSGIDCQPARALGSGIPTVSTAYWSATDTA